MTAVAPLTSVTLSRGKEVAQWVEKLPNDAKKSPKEVIKLPNGPKITYFAQNVYAIINLIT